jgi:hypothetical protein
VRPVAASTIDISSRMSQFYHRQRHFDLGAEHEFGPLQLDYNAVRSIDRINGSTGGDGGVLINRVTGVGWILDRTQSDLYPRFIQTAGPDISNPASYRPNSYNFADPKTAHEILQLSANARFKLPTEMALFVKIGARLREEFVGDQNKSKRYNFIGINSAQLPTDPTIKTFGDQKTGLKIPAWNSNAIARGRTPLDSALWTEDRYFHEMSKYTGTRSVTETVSAGYLMAQGKIGRTGFLGGVRRRRRRQLGLGAGASRQHRGAAGRRSGGSRGPGLREYAARDIRQLYEIVPERSPHARPDE